MKNRIWFRLGVFFDTLDEALTPNIERSPFFRACLFCYWRANQ